MTFKEKNLTIASFNDTLDEIISKGNTSIKKMDLNDLAFVFLNVKKSKNYESDMLKIKEIMYNHVEDHITSSEFVKFKAFVNKDIYDKAVKKRCNLERKYMKDNNKKDVLLDIAAKFEILHPLNMNKTQLCASIQDLNELARAKVQKTLGKCVDELNKMDKTSEDLEHKKYDFLYNDLLKLSEMVNEWDSLNTYYKNPQCKSMKDGKCADVLESLHQLSIEVMDQSNRCGSEIKSLKKSMVKRNIKRREQAGVKVGRFEKFKSKF